LHAVKTMRFSLSQLLAIGLLLGGLAQGAETSEMVTIPKARLEELEQKERELARLTGQLTKTRNENQQLKKQREEAVKASSVEPLKQPLKSHDSPPLASLAPVDADAVIESMDLANYFQLDKASADQRFRRRKFIVSGDIVAFEKPLARRNYRVLLQVPEGGPRVICDLPPPEKASAVFTVDHGSQIVAAYGEQRVPLAKVGQKAKIKGECHGLSDGTIMIYASELGRVR
jgi:hypothetical protein